MNRLFLLFLLLSMYTACTSVNTPKTDSWPDPPGGYESLILLSPSNGADSISANVALQWEEVDGASSYDIQVAVDQDFASLVTDGSSDSALYEITGLKPGTTYYWRVKTESRWSGVWNFTTLKQTDVEPSSAPVLAAPEDGAQDQSINLEMRWKAVAGSDEYQVQIDSDQTFNAPVADVTVTSASFDVTGLEHDQTYFWRVRSFADHEQSLWSEVRSFTTMPETAPPPSNGSSSDIWVSAYFASWNHYAPPGGNWGNMPTEAIDWDAFTHLFYFAMGAQTNGTLSEIAEYENMNPDRINTIVSAAHRHNKPVIITVGGWGNYNGFSQAITPAVRPVFILNLVALIKTWGFDGIDLDMEPIRDGDWDNYKAFVRDLHTALQTLTTPLGNKPLLTAATSWEPALFSDLQQYFDQINIMTYDFSGAWEGWVSWHNSPIYNGGLTFPGLSKPLPSIHRKLQAFIDAGVSREKLGIGIDFYGYVWNGQVTGPGQGWDTPPQVEGNVPYYKIMNNYYSTDVYRWDEQAQAAYLSIDSSDPSQKKFISYDDERSIQAKIDYTREQGIGGVIIWELSGGYRENQPVGSRDPLLQAVKDAVW